MERERESSSYSRSSLSLVCLLGIGAFFASRLFKAYAPVYKHANTHPAKQSDHKCGECQSTTDSAVRVIVDSIPASHTPPQERESEHKWKNRREWGMLGVQFLTLIAVILYATITYRMWCEMQKQTRIQRETGINTERAWVGLDVPITIDSIAVENANVAIKGHYSVKNFGHGPAVKVIESGNFAYDPSNSQMTAKEAKFTCDASVAFATGKVPVAGTMNQSPPFGYTLFPGKEHDEVIDYRGGVSTTKFLQFIGCVAYIDQFKAAHWTRFCMQRKPGDHNPLPKLEFCSLYNDTDNFKQ